MWFVINIIILILGISLIGYGKYIDSSENIEALLLFIFGAIIIVSASFSEILRWIFG